VIATVGIAVDTPVAITAVLSVVAVGAELTHAEAFLLSADHGVLEAGAARFRGNSRCPGR